ncbi:MAG: twin-arginine translocase subunit TatB [Candidatus Pelagibacter sp. TMED197]|nr:twin-arginine translocase subunit TatB [Candidatus Pelagibacter sp.]OUW58585.1 MAG: twin-arginine translocase subunit TatB [Candidatus Pelagibacter sp. TMED197]|tara:strand:- start:2891 stop:3130 length:240 start_codon:yes stop_codon:yes gene_type:complete
MPQIGWLEILAVVIVAILVLGPKEFPIALKKIGSYIGKIKNTFSNFQREVTSVTDDIDIEKEISKKTNIKKKDKENLND